MLAFIRALVTAAGPPELEQLQAEGLVNGNEPAQPRRILDRCMVSQLDLSDDLFVEFGVSAIIYFAYIMKAATYHKSFLMLIT